jgi:hypothetical protein
MQRRSHFADNLKSHVSLQPVAGSLLLGLPSVCDPLYDCRVTLAKFRTTGHCGFLVGAVYPLKTRNAQIFYNTAGSAQCAIDNMVELRRTKSARPVLAGPP